LQKLIGLYFASSQLAKVTDLLLTQPQVSVSLKLAVYTPTAAKPYLFPAKSNSRTHPILYLRVRYVRQHRELYGIWERKTLKTFTSSASALLIPLKITNFAASF
jgi:hypothetical protein